MLIIDKYIKPKSLNEAYQILNTVPNSQIIGGGVYLRLSTKKVSTAIDLYDLSLDFIREIDNSIEIGAMTSFRDLETSKILADNFGSLFSDALKDIVGVQLKNSVTVGGSIFPKYGFSDLITPLLSLNCKLVFYESGQMSLSDFLNNKFKEKDILIKIVLEKENTKSSFKAFRNSAGDYSVLNVAISRTNGKFKIAIGARPWVAVLAGEAEDFLNSQKDINQDIALEAGEIASKSIDLGSNYLASSEYRKEICKVLVKRGIMEVVK